MRPLLIVKAQISSNSLPRLADRAVSLEIDLLIFGFAALRVSDRYRSSTTTLLRQAPLPSMRMTIFLRSSTPVQSMLLNWLLWSVLKISGCFLQRLNAEIDLHRDRHAMAQNLAVEPVDAKKVGPPDRKSPGLWGCNWCWLPRPDWAA